MKSDLFIAKNAEVENIHLQFQISFTYLKQEKLIRRHSLSFSTFNIKSLFLEGCARVVRK